MALNQAQLMAVPGGPGVVGAVQAGTGISINNGVISAVTYSGSTPPPGPRVGELWYDTSVNPPTLKVWSGSQWEPVSQASGTVTSVGVTGTNGIVTTGSPITGAGTITVNFPVNLLPSLP